MINHRNPLRTDVLDEVCLRWADGRLPPGRINESALADELGISRTPLREALLIMEQRGMLESTMGRGFQVPPLTREEAEELYPLLSVLEAMALRLVAPALQGRVAELRDLLARMAATDDPHQLNQLGADWSKAVIGDCPNQRLLQLLQHLYRHASRYEHATLQRGFPVASAIAQHHAIVDAIEAGDIDLAVQRLAGTWSRCLDALRTWLPTAAQAEMPQRRFKR
jgi:DNA-binding GntR family transcriptional regulator